MKNSDAGDCDLSRVPGLFKLQSNGKYNYDETYKMKRGRKNPANGELLVNPGKILKGNGLIRHVDVDQEFSGKFFFRFYDLGMKWSPVEKIKKSNSFCR